MWKREFLCVWFASVMLTDNCHNDGEFGFSIVCLSYMCSLKLAKNVENVSSCVWFVANRYVDRQLSRTTMVESMVSPSCVFLRVLFVANLYVDRQLSRTTMVASIVSPVRIFNYMYVLHVHSETCEKCGNCGKLLMRSCVLCLWQTFMLTDNCQEPQWWRA